MKKISKLHLAVIMFFLSTGCRNKEVCTLDRGDIDIEAGQAIVLGKNGRHRTVYFDYITALALSSYLEERTDDNSALFVGKYGERMNTLAMQRLVREVGKAAGLEKNISPCWIRHNLILNNADLKRPAGITNFTYTSECITTEK